MANKSKGEVGFTAGGKPYTLRFGQEAMEQLENTLDMVFIEIIDLFESKKFRFSQVRTMFWAGLIEHHPEFTTPDDIKPVLNDLLPKDSMRMLGEAFGLSLANVEEPPAGPPKPELGAAFEPPAADPATAA